ncbi:MAG: hypothetical protein ACOYN3_00600 [Acidimicrobiia bacterium]
MSDTPWPPLYLESYPPTRRAGSRVLRVGLILLVIGLVLATAGIGVGLWQVIGVFDHHEELPRVQVPTTQTIDLQKGNIDIWFEARSELFVEPNKVALAVIDPNTGDELVIRTPASSETFSGDNQFSKLVGVLVVPATGSYEVIVTGTGAETITFGNVGVAAFAIGIGLIVIGVFLGGLIALVGVVLIIIGIVKRSNARHAQVLH